MRGGALDLVVMMLPTEAYVGQPARTLALRLCCAGCLCVELCILVLLLCCA